MTLSKTQYTLYTGLTTALSENDFADVVSIAEMRLASFLCLEVFPDLDGTNKDLAMLLANFISAMFKFQGDGDAVTSKHVRNFTINFKSSSAADAFSQIANQYGDIIDKYSECGVGVKVERRRYDCCGWYRNGRI